MRHMTATLGALACAALSTSALGQDDAIDAAVDSAAAATAEAATDQSEQAQRVHQFAELPYWPGYWVSEYQAGTTITGLAPVFTNPGDGEPVPFSQVMSLRGADAKWNEEGQRRWEHVRSIAGGRKATGWGYPMMMNSGTPIQFLITPEEVIIVNAYSETRHIYTDGRPMPDEMDMWPTTWGTSVGHWEGDTLVIETVMVDTPSDYFHGAPPFSEDARYVERIRMEGDRLVAEFTVDDPTTLIEPFTSNISWVREEGFDRMIVINWENDRTGVEDGLNTIETTTIGD